MATIPLWVCTLFAHLTLLSSAYCPDFPCGNGLFKIPFTNMTDLSCTFLRVSCLEPTPRIQFKYGGHWYEIVEVSPADVSVNDKEPKHRICEFKPGRHLLTTNNSLSSFNCSHGDVTDLMFITRCWDNDTYGTDVNITFRFPKQCSLIPPPADDNIWSSTEFPVDMDEINHCYWCPENEGQCHAKSGKCMKGKSKSLAYKAAAAIGIIAVVVVLIVVTLYYFRKTKQNKTYHEVRSKLIKHGALQVTVYCYSDVKKMTRSFVDKLGQGGFGSVYKGELDDGRLVAVKVLKQSKREHALGKEKPRGIDDGLDQFINEVATISATSHVNVVTLLGFCFEPRFWFEGTRRALVFEYMSEGSLDKLLFDQSKMGKLNWEKRYQISIGIARGLEYLHTGCNKRIVHFDIKPGNILLDKDFVPKISDFGLAKTCSEKMSLVSMSGLRGTWGYIAPEIYYNRNFQGVSHKSDVYSYGMMVLDIVGARKNIDNIADNSSEAQFPDYIYKHLEVDEEMEMSERIINEEDRVQKRKMIIVSLWCIQNDPSNRPTMSNVIKMLEANLESLQAPPKRCPSFPSRTPPTNSSTTFESL